MIYITYDKETNEITIRPIKELKLKLNKVFDKIEVTKLVDIDGQELLLDPNSEIIYNTSLKLDVSELLEICRHTFFPKGDRD